MLYLVYAIPTTLSNTSFDQILQFSAETEWLIKPSIEVTLLFAQKT